MSRALLILANDMVRAKAADWCRRLPEGTRVEFKEPKRSLDQNARFWAMLTDVSMQKEHNGRRYPPDMWKHLFLHACGRETQFIPALDGQGFLPLPQSSSDLSKSEMSEVMQFIEAWGAENGVAFHEPEARAA